MREKLQGNLTFFFFFLRHFNSCLNSVKVFNGGENMIFTLWLWTCCTFPYCKMGQSSHFGLLLMFTKNTNHKQHCP